MSIEGRIAVDVSFADSAASSGVQSVKKIALVDTTSYATGKVAIVAGTCGTAGVSVTVTSPGYKNAQGDDVTFANIERFAFRAVPGGTIIQGLQAIGRSKSDICIYNMDGASTASYSVRSFSGTASYTLVLYGT